MALWKARLTIAAMAAVALFSASAAKAQTCESLPNPIYIAGSTASQPMWTHVGPILFDAGVTIVYQNQGSCTGVTYIEQEVTDPLSTTNGVSGTGIYFPGTTADGGTSACTITPASGTVETVNVGISDVFEATCDAVNSATNPGNVGHFNGPTQSMLFLQPREASISTHEISAEEAFYVLGYSGGGMVAPWNQTEENNSTAGMGFLAIRNQQSGTQSMIAGAIALPAPLFLGIDEKSGGNVVTALEGVVSGSLANPQSYLGIAVAGSYDTQRSKLQALAFRGYGQPYAWLPDSSDTSFDKQNIRQGLYPISGPLQFIYVTNNADGSGAASDPRATTLINYLNGTTPIPGVTIEAAEIAASTIPDCAMGVTRPDNNYYSLVPNHRAHSCDCYFNSKVTGSTTSCTACSGPSGCPGGYCGPNGVCEAF